MDWNDATLFNLFLPASDISLDHITPFAVSTHRLTVYARVRRSVTNVGVKLNLDECKGRTPNMPNTGILISFPNMNRIVFRIFLLAFVISAVLFRFLYD